MGCCGNQVPRVPDVPQHSGVKVLQAKVHYVRTLQGEFQHTLSTQVSKTKTYFPPEQKTDTKLQLEKKFLQPMRSKFIRSSVSDSVCPQGLREGYRVKECFTERLVICLSACIEGILRLFTNLYLHRKGQIFSRNDSDFKDVDLYNTRKRYAVTESLDLTRNISWLASCFSKIKKPNKHCSGNQSVIAGVRIFDTISYIYP